MSILNMAPLSIILTVAHVKASTSSAVQLDHRVLRSLQGEVVAGKQVPGHRSCRGLEPRPREPAQTKRDYRDY